MSETFNSLFEMRLLHSRAQKAGERREELSILYLRCEKLKQVFETLGKWWAFNSLFEMHVLLRALP